MINFVIQVICPCNLQVVYEYYCTTRAEAEWLATTLMNTITEDVVLIDCRKLNKEYKIRKENK